MNLTMIIYSATLGFVWGLLWAAYLKRRGVWPLPFWYALLCAVLFHTGRAILEAKLGLWD